MTSAVEKFFLAPFRGKPINDVKATPVPEPTVEPDSLEGLDEKLAELNAEKETAQADVRTEKARGERWSDELHAKKKAIASGRVNAFTQASDPEREAEIDRKLAKVEEQLQAESPATQRLTAINEQIADIQQRRIALGREQVRTVLLPAAVQCETDLRGALGELGTKMFTLGVGGFEKLLSSRSARADLDAAVDSFHEPHAGRVQIAQRRTVENAVRKVWLESPPTPAEALGLLFLRFTEWSRLPGSPAVDLWAATDIGASPAHPDGMNATNTYPFGPDDLYQIQQGHFPKRL